MWLAIDTSQEFVFGYFRRAEEQFCRKAHIGIRIITKSFVESRILLSKKTLEVVYYHNARDKKQRIDIKLQQKNNICWQTERYSTVRESMRRKLL